MTYRTDNKPICIDCAFNMVPSYSVRCLQGKVIHPWPIGCDLYKREEMTMTNEEFRAIRMGTMGQLKTSQISFILGIEQHSMRGYLNGRCKIPKDVQETMRSFEREILEEQDQLEGISV